MASRFTSIRGPYHVFACFRMLAIVENGFQGVSWEGYVCLEASLYWSGLTTSTSTRPAASDEPAELTCMLPILASD